MLTPEQLDKFIRLAGALSPENLHCDGEISRTAAKRRERVLRTQWKALETAVGRRVSEDEVWLQYIKTRP
jgi:hypothetical protein